MKPDNDYTEMVNHETPPVSDQNSHVQKDPPDGCGCFIAAVVLGIVSGSLLTWMVLAWK